MSIEKTKLKIVIIGDGMVGKDFLCLSLSNKKLPEKSETFLEQYEYELKIDSEYIYFDIR
jgi:GTPase SAR1 family protein